MLTITMMVVGALLVAIAMAETPVQRLPLSSALVYLAVGWAATAAGVPLARLNLPVHAGLLSLLCEWALLVSLFAIGLRLGIPQRQRPWRVATLLASGGLLVMVALVAVVSHGLLALPWPAALMLGAILAPTDPVLASDVQVHSETDRDAVRLSLTAEGALNDGTAFPVVMLALAALGVHDAGDWGLHWLWHDLGWPVAGGLALGAACGRGVGIVLRKRLRGGHAVQWDELLYVGLLGFSYGAAVLLGVSPFLAVFAAGAMLFFQSAADTKLMNQSGSDGSDLLARMSAFGARCERLVEVMLVLLIGALMPSVEPSWRLCVFVVIALAMLRPLSVMAVIRRSAMPARHRRLVAWFGIRGVGSLYYLAYALAHAPSAPAESVWISATLACVATSIVLHGISATPLMNSYQRRRYPRNQAQQLPTENDHSNRDEHRPID